ncbi:MAG: hypothetical protein H5U26_00710 [Immundisolibacter sp.]|uniref:hypothetical protein n=1 Tax=Immundisolibacter sp. TaxID=1934948 RepID=UPI0019B964CC|nr:hypothetical protein [Immundisolibacter sp.]MBC7160616.1 hypothetical protein [Immundisolibacter sp.]
MTWLSEKMTPQQKFVWERRADVDLRLAGTTRWFRLSEAPGARFAAVLVFLDWLDTFGAGVSAAVTRITLAAGDCPVDTIELSMDVLDALGLQPPPAGRHLHRGQTIDIVHLADLDGDDEALI